MSSNPIGTMEREAMAAPPDERRNGNDLRAAYRRRTKLLWIVALVAVLGWYGFAAIEASSLGYAPLARRPFTLLALVVYVVVWGAVLLAVLEIRRCPRCGHGFGIRPVEVCPSCGGRVG